MALLLLRVEIDIDPTLEDPQEVAEFLLQEPDGRWQEYCDVRPSSVTGEWAAS